MITAIERRSVNPEIQTTFKDGIKIALCGYSRSGKDTVGQLMKQYLEENGHGRTKQLAFGDELKSRFYDTFPMARSQKKPREWFETFGELGRQVNPNIWIEPVAFYVKHYTNAYKNFIITDLRQPNEAKWVRENGFVLIYVFSPVEIREQRAKGDSSFIPVTSSESLMNTFEKDYVVFNKGSLTELKKNVNNLMRILINDKTEKDGSFK